MDLRLQIKEAKRLLAFLLLCSCSPRLSEEDLSLARTAMTARLSASGIRDRSVLAAMEKVARHSFLHGKLAALAYEDRPLSIGYGQTVAAPRMLARMLEIVNLRPDEKVLEIRTGSGYPTALLAELAKEVFTVEAVKPVAEEARKRLESLGYQNIRFHVGDLYQGWSEKGPFDAILVLAAADHVPQALLEQLAEGGRLLMPLGDLRQELVLIKKQRGEFRREEFGGVDFGPLLRERDLTPSQKGN